MAHPPEKTFIGAVLVFGTRYDIMPEGYYLQQNDLFV
jgi:hypothetical protein